MRVLITTDTVGGVWRFTQELSVGLLEAECGVALVSVGAPDAGMQGWVLDMRRRWRERFRFESLQAPLEWMPDNARAYADAGAHLLRIGEDFGADLLHANQFCFGALPMDVPRIITAHSDVLSWAESCGVELDESDWLRRYRALVSDGLDEADAVVAPTAWMLGAVAEGFSLPAARCVVPNGRSMPQVPRTERKLQAITAGRLWDEAKNIVLLAGVKSPVPLLVAGATKCEQAFAPTSLGEACLLGSLPEHELLALFGESAIYLCTSRYEPFGLAPLEAALCGCAVVANDIPSLREVWRDGALYFRDAAGLSSLLDTLHSDRRLLRAAQCQSFARARHFTRERVVEGYLAVYRSVLSDSRELAHVA
jgi:glycogen(starch) synthase